MDLYALARIMRDSLAEVDPVPILEGAVLLGSVKNDPGTLVFINYNRQSVIQVSVQTPDGEPFLYDYWTIVRDGKKAFVAHRRGTHGDGENDEVIDTRLT